jgi:hypothetical protein
MKKIITMIALAAISFGSVYAHTATINSRSTLQTDTTKKTKKKMKRDSTKKKDSTMVKQQK